MSGKRMPPRFLLLLVALLLFALVPGFLFADDPIAIHGVGTSHQKLANGDILLKFSVRIDVRTSPLTYNYHWERSDGAKSAEKVASVKKGVTSIVINDAWQLGPNSGLKEVWEQLFINTGNTHLSSEQIKIAVPK